MSPDHITAHILPDINHTVSQSHLITLELKKKAFSERCLFLEGYFLKMKAADLIMSTDMPLKQCKLLFASPSAATKLTT